MMPVIMLLAVYNECKMLYIDVQACAVVQKITTMSREWASYTRLSYRMNFGNEVFNIVFIVHTYVQLYSVLFAFSKTTSKSDI